MHHSRFAYSIYLSLIFGVMALSGCDHHNPVLAVIGKETIKQSDFEPYYQQFLKDFSIQDQSTARQQCLKAMVENRLLEQIACSLGMDTTQQYRLKKKQVEMITTISHFKQDEVRKKLQIDSVELRRAYHRSLSRIKLHYLYSPEKSGIDSIYRVLTAFPSPSSVSSDQGLSWSESYDLSFGEMEKEIEDHAYALKPGQYSTPIASLSGYYIIQVIERIDHPFATETDFLQKQEHITMVLKERKVQEILQQKSEAIIEQLNFRVRFPIFQRFYQLTQRVYPLENGLFPEDILYEARGKRITVGEVLDKIRLVYPEDRNWIRTERQLEKFLLSLAFRDHLYSLAQHQGYDRSLTVQSEIRRKMNFYLVDQLNEMLTQKVSPAAIEDFYRDHRDSLETQQGPLLEMMVFPTRDPTDSIYQIIKRSPDLWKKLKTRIRTQQYEWAGLDDLPPEIRTQCRLSLTDQILPPFFFRQKFWLAKILRAYTPLSNQNNLSESLSEQIRQVIMNQERKKFLNYWLQRIRVRIDSLAIRNLNS